jgi:hypothetical protein
MDSTLQYKCTVTNTGSMDGDEVVLVYHNVSQAIRDAANHPIPLKSLVDFQRVTVTAGQTVTLSFELTDRAFTVVNADGDRVTYSGTHTLIFSRGVGDDSDVSLSVEMGPLAPRKANKVSHS